MPTAPSQTSFSFRRIFPVLWIIGLITLAALAFQPASTGVSRWATLGLVSAMITTVLRFIWKWRGIRFGILGGILLLGIAVAIPWKIKTSPDRLRDQVVQHLRSFDGCEYYWGGEARGGIDCSGLIRRGMIDASLSEGFRTLDLGLVRHGLSLWWNDTSAEALGKEHAGLTKRLADAPNLHSLDHKNLLPGDIAVTAGGGHILAYIGHETWIEADPGEGKVVTIHAPTSPNPWLKMKVWLLRWTILADPH